MLWSKVLLVVFSCQVVLGLDNGLARTPPMGWMHWQRFRCVTDCVAYPNECVSENLFMRIADKMVADGYKEAGYEYVIVDDCWSAMERGANNTLVGDPDRFPSGMKALGDYIHNLGLKFGLYGDYGTYTCAGYPGSLGHLKIDAQTYADWGVDYVKFDACYTDGEDIELGYVLYGSYLKATGRPIVYSCTWPAYQESSGIEADYGTAKEICNLWRNYGDIDDSWQSVETIGNWFSKHQDRLVPNSGPGHWNDPDMLIIGDFGLSLEQSKSQMTMWAILAAPLIMSNDLDAIGKDYKAILLNKDIIAVNQDAKGEQGRMVKVVNRIHAWMKPILSTNKIGHDAYAIGFISHRTDGIYYRQQFHFYELGIIPMKYEIKDLFTKDTWVMEATDVFTVRVPPSGAVFYRVEPLA